MIGKMVAACAGNWIKLNREKISKEYMTFSNRNSDGLNMNWQRYSEVISAEYHAEFLDRFYDELNLNLLHKTKKTVLIYRDNANMHLYALTHSLTHSLVRKFVKFADELPLHPSYSLDLGPTKYFLFSNLKK